MSMQLRLAQVVKVIPQYRLCEIVMCDDGWRATDVPVMTSFVSTNTGGWMMHNHPRPPSEELAGGLQPEEARRTILAVVAFVDGRPVIVGFLPHPMTQLAFVEDEQNREIHRHPSGTLTTINKHGDLEVQHTGGMFLRVAFDNAAGPADRHQDLTPLCANENWELPENEPPTVTLSIGNKNGEGFKLRVRPNGDTDVMSSGNLNIRYEGEAHIDIGGDAQVHVGGSATLSAEGDIKARTPASVTVSAGGSATVQAQGDASLLAGGSATVAAGGSAMVGAGGSVTVAGGGDVSVGSAGSVTVASGAPMTLAAPEITAVTAVLLVTGKIIEGGGFGIFGGALGGAMGAGIGGSGAAAGGAAGGAAAGEVAAAGADVAEARARIEEGVQEAVETSSEARGTGAPDNEGGEGA